MCRLRRVQSYGIDYVAERDKNVAVLAVIGVHLQGGRAYTR